MKIRLKLTKSQVQGLAVIAKCTFDTIEGNGFDDIQYKEALRGLIMKIVCKLPCLKEKNIIVLTDMEALVLWEITPGLTYKLGPFEKSLVYIIINEIDKQCSSHCIIMRGNLLSINEYYE